MAVVMLCFESVVALAGTDDHASLLLLVMAFYMAGNAYGSVIAPLLHNESLLLPSFARRLGQAGLVLFAAFYGVWLIALVSGGGTLFSLGGPGLYALLFVIGVAVSIQRIYLVLIVPAYLVPVMATPGQQTTILADVGSLWGQAGMVGMAALIVWHVFGARLRGRDPAEARSPMASIMFRRSASDADKPPGDDRSAIARLVHGLFDLGANANAHVMRAADAIRNKSTRWRRLVAFRSVLLPYDNPLGVAVNAMLTLLSVGIYCLFQRYSNPSTATSFNLLVPMAIVFGRLRMQTIGVRLNQMKPSLGDLYLAAAPATYRAFQCLVFDTLATLIPVVWLHTMLGGALLYVLSGCDYPIVAFAALGIAAISMSAIELTATLHGSDSRSLRWIIGLFTTGLCVGAYYLIYWVCTEIGTPWGLLLTGVPILVLCAGVFWLARDSYADRTPSFSPS